MDAEGVKEYQPGTLSGMVECQPCVNITPYLYQR